MSLKDIGTVLELVKRVNDGKSNPYDNDFEERMVRDAIRNTPEAAQRLQGIKDDNLRNHIADSLEMGERARDMFNQIENVTLERLKTSLKNTFRSIGNFAKNIAKTTATFAKDTLKFAWDHKALSGVTLAIAAITAGYVAYQKHQQALIDQGKEAASSWNEQRSSLISLYEQYNSLKGKLDSGDLSEAETVNTKQQILDLQNQIIDTYGAQAAGIDLVNGKLDEEKQKILDIANTEAERSLHENDAAFKKSADEMQKERNYILGKISIPYYSDSGLEHIVEKYDEISTTEADGEFWIRFIGDAKEADEVLNKFMSDVDDLKSQAESADDYYVSETLGEIYSESSNVLTDNKEKILDNYLEAYKTYMQQTMFKDGKGMMVSDVLNAVNKYNEALSGGDETVIDEAAEAYYNAIENKNHYISSDSNIFGDRLNMLFEDALSGLDEVGIKYHDFKEILDTGRTIGENMFEGEEESITKFSEKLKESELDVVDAQQILKKVFDKDYRLSLDSTTAEIALRNLGELLGLNTFSADEAFEETSSILGKLGLVADGTAESINRLYEKMYKPDLGIDSRFSAIEAADETENGGDDYIKAQTYLEEAKEMYDKGLIGTDDFQARAAYFSPTGAKDYTNFAENYSKATRYLTEDTSGLINFLNDLEAKGYATYETLSDGTKQWSYDIDDLEQASHDMGIGFDFMLDIFGRLNDYGFSNNFVADIETGAQRVTDLTKQLAQAEAELAELETEGQYETTDENGNKQMTKGNQTAIDAKRAEIQALKEDILATQDAMDQLLEHSAADYDKQITQAKSMIESLKQSRDEALKTNEYGENTQQVVAMIEDQISAIASKYHIELDAEMNVVDNKADIEDMIMYYSGQLSEMSESLGLDAEIFNFDASKMSLEEIKEKIEELEGIEIDPNVNPKGAEHLDNLIKKCEQEYQLKLSVTDEALAANEVISAIQTRITELLNSTENSKVLTLKAVIDGDQQIADYAAIIASLPADVQTTIGVTEENVGNAQAILDQIASAPESLNIDASVTGTDEVAGLNTEISETNDKSVSVGANVFGTSLVWQLKEEIKGLNDKTVNLRTNIYKTTYVEEVKKSKASGTMNQNKISGATLATGTMIAHADGTAHNVLNMTPAHAGGSVALPHDETALVNEMGIESVVRQGKWMLLPGGAHFQNLKKGDIIFNAEQTKSLLEKGKIAGHARAYAGGTIGSNAYAKGSGGGFFTSQAVSNSSTGTKNTSTNNAGNTKTNQSNEVKSTMEKFQEWTSSLYDWIQVTLATVARTADRYYAKAQGYIENGLINGKNYKNAQTNLEKAISTLTKQLNNNTRAYYRYMEQANTAYNKAYGSLSNASDKTLFNNAVTKIKQGTVIDISSYSEDVRTAIDAYKQWYDLAMDSQTNIDDLKSTIKSYGEELYNLPLDYAAEKTDKLTQSMDKFKSVAEMFAEGRSSIGNYLKVLQDSYKISKDPAIKAEIEKLKKDQQRASNYNAANLYEIYAMQNAESINKANQQALKDANSNAKKTQKAYDSAKTSKKNSASSILKKYSKSLTSAQKTALKNGNKVSTLGVTDKNLLSALNSYNNKNDVAESARLQNIAAKAAQTTAMENATQSALEAAEARSEYAQTRFENASNYYDAELSHLQQVNSLSEKRFELAEAQGKYESQEKYDTQIKNMEAELKLRRKSVTDMQKELDSLVSKGYIKKNSEEWREMTEEINAAKEGVQDCNVEIANLKLDKLALYYEKTFDRVIAKLDQFSSKLSSINDLITNEMMYDYDTGYLTEMGATSMLLDAQQLDNSYQSLKKYVKQRDDIMKRYNNGEFGQAKFDELMEDIDGKIQSTVSNINSVRNQILEIVRTQTEAEKNAIFKVIDARKEMWQKQKDYYDWDKTLKNKTKDIQLLEQQIQALNGVEDAEARAQKARLEAQKAELTEEFGETIKDHVYEMKVTGLDELQKQLDEDYARYIYELSGSLDKMTDAIKDAITSASDTATDTLSVISGILTHFGLNPSDMGITAESLQHNATGTKSAKAGWSMINEKGREMILTSNGQMIVPLNTGDKVFTKEMSDNLWNIAKNQTVDSFKVASANIPDSIGKNYGDISPIVQCPVTINGNANEQDVINALTKAIPKISKAVQNDIRKDLRKSGLK